MPEGVPQGSESSEGSEGAARSGAASDDVDVDRWSAELRADATIAERARVAALRRQATFDLTRRDVLVDLAERAAPARLVVAGGTRVEGTVVALAADHAELRTATGRAVVPLATLALVELAPGAPPPTAREEPRPPAASRTLAVVVAELAEAQADAVVAVALGAGPGGPLRGRVRAGGRDVLVLEGPSGPVVVALEAVAALWWTTG